MTVEDVFNKARQYMTDEECEFLKKAYEFAKEAHKHQFRKSGEPYINHPVEVAGILVDLGMDYITVAAGFLHDVVEDTDITLDDLKREFNEDIAHIVDGVTKLKKIKFKSKADQQAENHRKLLVAMARDIRCILIKLADRLHNMRTLKYMPKEKQLEIANETLEIFAPLAHRLGISTIKWELEDISLRYLNPQQYYRIVNLIEKRRVEREKNVEEVKEAIRRELEKVNIQAEIFGRPKHIYSIYRKMVLQNRPFSEIYDLLAVRVIVDSIRDCYAALGIIHTCWKPLPGRFKDHIAMPKANMYQSLHTTVIGPNGEPVEVQIRTKEMHRVAEYGVAAHWAYKEGKKNPQSSFEKKLTWFRQILEWQKEAHDAKEFVESLKMDLFSDTVLVFTPKSDVIELPAGSVPIDFAYRIHTEIGNKMIGAKVNNKIVPLDYKLKTGDIVEIITSNHSYGPSRDWLKIAKSSHAKNKIKQWFKKQKREENLERGKELVEEELRELGFDPAEVLTKENLQNTAKKFNFTSEEDMYVAVGFGGITAAQIATRLTEKFRKQKQETLDNETLLETLAETKQSRIRPRKSDSGVRVKGVDNLLIRLSKCCNPVPGDEIVGFITKGRGVSIHRTNCPNVQREEAKERLIEVEWIADGDSNKNYHVDIEITGYDRKGLLNDVLQAIAESKTDIQSVSGRTDRNKMTTVHMTILIHNVNHLQKVVDRIKRIHDIYSVRRVIQ